MSNINLNKHYLAFRWAVSKDWKDKNRLYESIQYKMEVLREEYGLSERDVVDDLFADYWEREHYLKYDESLGSLNNWIAYYVYFYLNHVIRRHSVRATNTQDQRIDPVDRRNQGNCTRVERDNIKDDPDYEPEVVIDTDDPEGYLIAKEMLELIYDHFGKVQADYLIGKIELDEAASISGISCDAFRKRIERRTRDFQDSLELLDQAER